MIGFVEKPNLPRGTVRSVICGTDDAEILNFFKLSGIEVIKSEPNFQIEKSVSSHADMAVFHLGENKVITDKNQPLLKAELSDRGMMVYETDKIISGLYPDNVRLNFAFVSDNVIGNFKYIDKNLLSLISDKKHINVKQGYCKCSVLVVSENALITDDTGIAAKAAENGLDCLFIGKGDIFLEGHEYGFIGGASGKISDNTIVFFGDIRAHRDFSHIEEFLLKHNCSFICSDDNQLRDIGGIIPLQEELKQY